MPTSRAQVCNQYNEMLDKFLSVYSNIVAILIKQKTIRKYQRWSIKISTKINTNIYETLKTMPPPPAKRNFSVFKEVNKQKSKTAISESYGKK